MKKYTGGCYCKAVRYEAEVDVTKVLSCNCSYCSIKGLLLSFIPASQFKLLSGEDHLTEYRFNKKVIAHLFCKTCGVQSFSRGTSSDGTATIALNVRCLDDINIEELVIEHFEGKDL